MPIEEDFDKTTIENRTKSSKTVPLGKILIKAVPWGEEGVKYEMLCRATNVSDAYIAPLFLHNYATEDYINPLIQEHHNTLHWLH